MNSPKEVTDHIAYAALRSFPGVVDVLNLGSTLEITTGTGEVFIVTVTRKDDPGQN